MTSRVTPPGALILSLDIAELLEFVVAVTVSDMQLRWLDLG